ncbi:glycosyltransferase [Listeria grandensis]|uniref:Glycosyltransferase n=1 Tax=Listeria grandensis TaxID=1494963 RepID=A0A7X0Y740_9LIST|nr:CDP-glycerol glycerophosphotransferase family protein [Listeria grandensis]MBC1473800.1 glycosyltransferase [Listeria grandensis]MBC1937622.1 glycosyltransferase [Listeria grandensis]
MKVGIIGFNVFSPGGTSRSNLNLTKEFNQEGITIVIYNARSFSPTDILSLRHQEGLSSQVIFKPIQDLGKDETIDLYIITRETFFPLAQLIKHYCPHAMVIGEIHAPLSLLPDNLATDLHALDCVRVATESIKTQFHMKYKYDALLVHHVSTHHVTLPQNTAQKPTSNLFVLSRFEDDVKDISYAIRLLDYLVHYHKATHIKLYIQGYGPSEMLYRNLINNYSLHANVFFNQGTPVDYIYFSTSRYETFGYSILEALAEGKRAILFPGEDRVLREIYGNPNNIQWITKDIQADAPRVLNFIASTERINYRQALPVIATPQNYVSLYMQQLATFKRQKQKHFIATKSVDDVWTEVLTSPVHQIPMAYQLYGYLKDKPVIGKFLTSHSVKNMLHSMLDRIEAWKERYQRTTLVNDNMYFIESFHGKSFSGDPKYMALWLKQNIPDAKIFVSSVNQLVDMEIRHFGMEALRLGSANYLQKFRMCKYIIVNGNPLDKAGKGANQVIIQTWHGLPLKKMVADLEDLKHRQQELSAFLPRMKKWDYLLTSSAFNTELFASAFLLKENPKLEILEMGAPRNAYLIQNRSRHGEKAWLHLKYFNRPLDATKKFILFCPTWRKQEREEVTGIDLKQLIENLPPEYEVIVKLHPLETSLRRLYKALDPRIHCFFNELVDIQELFILVDVLISDYSSAIFDYAHLNKKIIILQEDSENYQKKVGWYFDMKTTCLLEGKSYTTESLTQAILEEDPNIFSYCKAIQNNLLNKDNVFTNEKLMHELFLQERL